MGQVNNNEITDRAGFVFNRKLALFKIPRKRRIELPHIATAFVSKNIGLDDQ